jgi:cupin 2 domain-containing protein
MSWLMVNNLLNNFPLPQGKEEIFEILCKRSDLRIERIISNGQITPEGQWYDSQEEEWVVLLQGKATLELEDGSQVNLQAGDYLLIPSHCKHRVIFTSQQPPCIWLAVHWNEK